MTVPERGGVSSGMLAGWMAIHEDELYEAWNQAVRNIPFNRIEPLK